MKSLLVLILAIVSLTSYGEIKNLIQKYNFQVAPNQLRSIQLKQTIKKVIHIKNAQGMRLHFKKLILGANNLIRVTSYADKQHVVFNDQRLIDFNYATPYLNGDKLLVEVYVPNRSAFQGISLQGVETPYAYASRTICGVEDNRIPSKIKSVGRMMKVVDGAGGCSATLISDTCMVSAGHCSAYLNVAQFNVPVSNADGTVNYPSPRDQYPLAKIIDFQDAGPGNDWAVFRMKKNPITKKFPGSVQGKVRFTLYPVKVGSKLSITGYGVDRNDPVRNMSQQVHAGLLKNGGSRSDATLRYQVDTEPGNSGSGIIDTRTRRLIGVHTHGGCDSGLNTEGNQGTSLAYHQRFKAAVYQCLREERKLKYQNR